MYTVEVYVKGIFILHSFQSKNRILYGVNEMFTIIFKNMMIL